MRRRPLAPRRGPGLVGTMARTAVVAGTATATVNAVNSSQAQKQQARANAAAESQAIADLQAQMEQMQAQEMQAAIPVAPAAPAAAPQSELVVKLQQLADLHAQGILSDEEFAAAKAKALSS